jgi:hypothetical protein
LFEFLDIGAVGIDADRHDVGTGGAERVERGGVGRIFHRDAVAAEELSDQCDRLLGAAGDDDLLGLRRQTARRVAAGDLAAQRGQAERQIAGRFAREPLELLSEPLAGGREFARSRQRGDRELDHLARTVVVVDDRDEVAW